jgi:hypothetical protein
MKKRLLQVLLCVSIPFMMHAQQTAKKASNCGCSFSSINQVGLTEGSAGSSFQIQTINGMRFRTWFAGAGVGLDHYRYRSIPVFFDLRKDLFRNKSNTPFVYGDIGVNIPWVDENKQAEIWWGTNSYQNGLYYDAGIGYKLNIGKGRGILFSGGYSMKKFTETRYQQIVCITSPCPPDDEGERFNFTLKRITIKAGIQL